MHRADNGDDVHGSANLEIAGGGHRGGQLMSSRQVSLGRRAAALAAGFAALQLAGSIGNALDLEILNIEAGQKVENLSPVLTVGEQVGERLFLRCASSSAPRPRRRWCSSMNSPTGSACKAALARSTVRSLRSSSASSGAA